MAKETAKLVKEELEQQEKDAALIKEELRSELLIEFEEKLHRERELIEHQKDEELQELREQLAKDGAAQVLAESLKESLMPFFLDDESKKYIKEMKAEYKREISMIQDVADCRTGELTALAESFNRLEEKLEENRKALLEKDLLLQQAEVKNYVFEKLRKDFKLRIYTNDLLNCESKKAVDKLIEAFTSVERSKRVLSDKESALVESSKTSEKGLAVTETVEAYLKEHGELVEEKSSESGKVLTEEQKEQRRMSGIEE